MLLEKLGLNLLCSMFAPRNTHGQLLSANPSLAELVDQDSLPEDELGWLKFEPYDGDLLALGNNDWLNDTARYGGDVELELESETVDELGKYVNYCNLALNHYGEKHGSSYDFVSLESVIWCPTDIYGYRLSFKAKSRDGFPVSFNAFADVDIKTVAKIISCQLLD